MALKTQHVFFILIAVLSVDHIPIGFTHSNNCAYKFQIGYSLSAKLFLRSLLIQVFENVQCVSKLHDDCGAHSKKNDRSHLCFNDEECLIPQF